MPSSTQNPALSLESISQYLTTTRVGKPTILLHSTDSTNAAAFELARQGTPDGTVVLSEQQSAGRGRLGRTWFSPSGMNIYCSIIFLDQADQGRPHQELSLIPLITGVAIARTLQQITRLSPTLKWPNDILIQKKKVAGILCERGGTSSNHSCLVIGFGINVNMEVADFPEDLRNHATSLATEAGQFFDRNLLVAHLLKKIEWSWTRHGKEHSSKILHAYRELCSTLGASVRVETSPGKIVTGRVLTIDDEGSLHLQLRETSTATPPLIIRSGEVIHLRDANEP